MDSLSNPLALIVSEIRPQAATEALDAFLADVAASNKAKAAAEKPPVPQQPAPGEPNV